MYTITATEVHGITPDCFPIGDQNRRLVANTIIQPCEILFRAVS
jgi:hypothetical protein